MPPIPHDSFSTLLGCTYEELESLTAMPYGGSGSPKGSRPIVVMGDKTYLYCWGEKNAPHLREKTEKGEGNSTSHEMTEEHLLAQMALRSHLLAGGGVEFLRGCIVCLDDTAFKETVKANDNRVEIEWRVAGNRSYDVAIVSKDAEKHDEAITIIEVLHTSGTAEFGSRPESVPWYEVKASEVLSEVERLDDTAGLIRPAMRLHCQRMTTQTCGECEFDRKLEPHRTYLKELDDAFPVHLRGFIELSQGKGHGSPVHCVLCDEHSSITWHHMKGFSANANEYERFRLCDKHLEALHKCVREDASAPEAFFSDAELVSEQRIDRAQKEFDANQRQAERRRKEEALRAQAEAEAEDRLRAEVARIRAESKRQRDAEKKRKREEAAECDCARCEAISGGKAEYETDTGCCHVDYKDVSLEARCKIWCR